MVVFIIAMDSVVGKQTVEQRRNKNKKKFRRKKQKGHLKIQTE